MTTLATALAAILGVQEADGTRVGAWIEDLGSTERKVRDRAVEELRRIGRAALPQLREAASAADAERALLARKLILELSGSTKEPGGAEPGPAVSLLVQDWVRGIRFRRHADGRVELTVPEQDGEPGGKRRFKTYRADSIEDFKRRHAELWSRYSVGKLLAFPGPGEDRKALLKRLQEHLGGEDGVEWPADSEFRDLDDLMRWIDAQERMIRRHLERWEQDDEQKPREDAAPSGPALGILVGPLDPALRSQLSLAEDAGLVVRRVRQGSLAERSGLKRSDVLLRLDGREIRDFDAFRKDLEKAMASKQFALDLLRKAKPLTVQVLPQSEAPDPSKK